MFFRDELPNDFSSSEIKLLDILYDSAQIVFGKYHIINMSINIIKKKNEMLVLKDT